MISEDSEKEEPSEKEISARENSREIAGLDMATL